MNRGSRPHLGSLLGHLSCWPTWTGEASVSAFHPVTFSTLGAASQQGSHLHPQTGKLPETEVGRSPSDRRIHEGGAWHLHGFNSLTPLLARIQNSPPVGKSLGKLEGAGKPGKLPAAL